jgi:hypothetical protein
MIETGVTYKRTTKSRKVLKELPDAWGVEGIRHYGKSISEVCVDVVVTCWYHGHIECLYRNGGIV